MNLAIGGGRGGQRRAGYVADKYARQLEVLVKALRSALASYSDFFSRR